MPLNIPFGVHFVDIRNHLVDNQNAANTRKIKKNLRHFRRRSPAYFPHKDRIPATAPKIIITGAIKTHAAT